MKGMLLLMSDTLTLYHGTIYDFDKINITHSKPFKDFGRGFYTTQSREHAVSVAVRNRDIILARLKETGIKSDIKMWLCIYEFPVASLNMLSVKVFTEPTREWMLFVSENRTNREQRHDYDIVIGPTANDRTSLSIKTYFFGGYGRVGSDDAVEILLRIIKPYELPPQMFFGTEKAIAHLTPTGKELLR
jgi:hypothetical protein